MEGPVRGHLISMAEGSRQANEMLLLQVSILGKSRLRQPIRSLNA